MVSFSKQLSLWPWNLRYIHTYIEAQHTYINDSPFFSLLVSINRNFKTRPSSNTALYYDNIGYWQRSDRNVSNTVSAISFPSTTFQLHKHK